MHSDSKIPLIGGTGHGRIVHVDPNTHELEIDVRASDEPDGAPVFTETYTRRRFDGPGFGEGFECFALAADDEIEQKELARWSIGQLFNHIENGERA